MPSRKKPAATAQTEVDFLQLLYRTIMSGRIERVKALLDSGLDPRGRQGPSGHTALYIACKLASLDAVKLLVEVGGCNVNESTGGDSTSRWRPLELAAVQGQMSILRYLIRKGADMNARNPCEQTALHIAATCGKVKSVALLARAGARVDTQDESGITPLISASSGGHVAVIRFLVSIGQDPSKAFGPDGLTPLFGAVEFGHSKAVRTLLQLSADETVRDKNCDPPCQKIGDARCKGPLAKFGMKPLSPEITDDIRRTLARGPAFRAVSWGWQSIACQELGRVQGGARVELTLPPRRRGLRGKQSIMRALCRYSSKT